MSKRLALGVIVWPALVAAVRADFASCGTIVQGVECPLFAADVGGAFVVSGLGAHQIGERVFVSGTLDPLCATICQEGDGCIQDATVAPCVGGGPDFDECGILIRGIECTLFLADSGGLYVVPLGGFSVGDRVQVVGRYNPECITFCQQGIGCIEDALVTLCTQPLAFNGLGEIVAGQTCPLFQADAGGRYVLGDLGGFGIGDRVCVAGTLLPGCATGCAGSQGCIFDNTIIACAPGAAFAGCGTLVRVQSCNLLQTDAGPVFDLGGSPGLPPALRVFARGVLSDACAGGCLGAPLCLENALVVQPGDTNCDQQIDFFDIDPFLLALFDADEYAAEHPECALRSADLNCDARVDFFDIDAFVAALFP